MELIGHVEIAQEVLQDVREQDPIAHLTRLQCYGLFQDLQAHKTELRVVE